MPKNNETEIRCSFCGKTQDEVTQLVEGPGVYICDNCIEFCSDLLFDSEDGLPISFFRSLLKLRLSLTNMS